ncbi:MAG: sigma-70 family RNA polymerase sigma factor [Bacillota bacterium]|nr:sigma-70 family RNA polymerase sigma factor [Bacillota bacterium]
MAHAASWGAEETEEELVRRAQQGDADAFEALVREHEKRLYRLARQALDDPEDAADAVQNAFLRAYRGLGRLENPAAFPAWLTRILVRECVSLLRARHPTVALDLLPELPAPESLDDGEVWRFVDELPGAQRLLLVLRFIYGYGPDEIAAMTGTPAGTVKSRLHRAVRLLGRRMAPGREER